MESEDQGHGAFTSGIPIAELDTAITGSKDLSGVQKNCIQHLRIADSSELEKKYTVGRKLGQGAFGTVFLVQENTTELLYACKSLKKKAGSPKQYEQLQREVAIMKLVWHPNIIKLHEVYETPKQIFLVMEQLCIACGAGELDERFRNCTENDVRVIIKKLSSAIGYLHMHGVVHRDLKPANILLSDSDPLDPLNIKLSDFGLATWVNKCTMMDNVCGTPLFMAPEILNCLPYSAQCDIWSVGVIMYMLLCGYTRNVEKSFQKMIANEKIEYPAEFWRNISAGAKSLCEAMLRTDPAKRISATEILMHPWIRGELGTKHELGQTNVLDLMKSYNTQRRLRKVLRVVQAAIRFMYPLRKRVNPIVASTALSIPATTLVVSSRRIVSKQHRASLNVTPSPQQHSAIITAASTNSLAHNRSSRPISATNSFTSISPADSVDSSAFFLPADSGNVSNGTTATTATITNGGTNQRKKMNSDSSTEIFVFGIQDNVALAIPNSCSAAAATAGTTAIASSLPRTDHPKQRPVEVSMSMSKIAAQERAVVGGISSFRQSAGSSSKTRLRTVSITAGSLISPSPTSYPVSVTPAAFAGAAVSNAINRRDSREKYGGGGSMLKDDAVVSKNSTIFSKYKAPPPSANRGKRMSLDAATAIANGNSNGHAMAMRGFLGGSSGDNYQYRTHGEEYGGAVSRDYRGVLASTAENQTKPFSSSSKVLLVTKSSPSLPKIQTVGRTRTRK